MKLKTKVWANTVRGLNTVRGTLIKKHKTPKGEWWEIKPDDTRCCNFKTRPSCVSQSR